jgi:hypothetical protein
LRQMAAVLGALAFMVGSRFVRGSTAAGHLHPIGPLRTGQ